MTARRRRAYRFGLRAETVASLFLMLKGYRILARRYRTPAGEVDLFVKRGNLIAFVEVKGVLRLTRLARPLPPYVTLRGARVGDKDSPM